MKIPKILQPRYRSDILGMRIGEICAAYYSASPVRQVGILEELGHLVDIITDPNFCAEMGARVDNRRSRFDPQRAKKIREEAELTQRGLARKLFGREGKCGIEGGTVMISRYEHGQTIPSNPPLKRPKKYMVWLALKGYNPYEIRVRKTG